MGLFFIMIVDCMIILAVVTLITQLVLPLTRRQLTFPFFRRLVRKISRPKPSEPKQKEPSQ